MGIVTEIEHSGVVPRTFEDTASVEASRLEGVVLQDELGDHCNYCGLISNVVPCGLQRCLLHVESATRRKGICGYERTAR